MFSVDIKTVILSLNIFTLICLVFMALCWAQNRRHFQGLALWVAGFSLNFAGLLFISLRGNIPDLISIILGNVLILGSALTLYIGLSIFIGLKKRQVHNYLVLGAVTCAQVYFSIISPDLDLRIAIFSAGITIFCTQCAWILFKHTKPESRRALRSAGIIMAIIALIGIFRIAGIIIFPVTGSDLFSTGIFDTSMVILMQVSFFFLTFSLILSVNQSLVSQISASNDELAFKAELLDNVSDSIIVHDDSGRFHYFNRAAYEERGFTKQEYLEKKLNDLVPPENRELVKQNIQEILNRGEYLFESANLRKDGSIMPVEVHSRHILHENQRLILSIVRNSSERKKIEGQLKQSLNQAQERQEELEALYSASRALMEQKEFTSAARVIFDICQKATGAGAGNVALLGSDSQNFTVLFFDSGGLPFQADNSRPLMVRGLIAEVCQRGQTRFENDFSHSDWVKYIP